MPDWLLWAALGVNVGPAVACSLGDPRSTRDRERWEQVERPRSEEQVERWLLVDRCPICTAGCPGRQGDLAAAGGPGDAACSASTSSILHGQPPFQSPTCTRGAAGLRPPSVMSPESGSRGGTRLDMFLGVAPSGAIPSNMFETMVFGGDLN